MTASSYSSTVDMRFNVVQSGLISIIKVFERSLEELHHAHQVPSSTKFNELSDEHHDLYVAIAGDDPEVLKTLNTMQLSSS